MMLCHDVPFHGTRGSFEVEKEGRQNVEDIAKHENLTGVLEKQVVE